MLGGREAACQRHRTGAGVCVSPRLPKSCASLPFSPKQVLFPLGVGGAQVVKIHRASPGAALFGVPRSGGGDRAAFVSPGSLSLKRGSLSMRKT